MATITSLGFSIFSTYSGTGMAAARRDVESTKNSLDGFSKSFSLLGTSVAAFGPAIAPVGTAVLGVGAALGTMTAAAGIAGGSYVFFMDKAIKSTLKLAKAHKDLTPVQQTFVNSVNQMKSAMNGVSTSTMPLTLHTATIFTQGLTAAIGQMTPLIRAVAPLADQVATSFKNWASGSGMKSFITLIIATGVPALKNLLHAGSDVIAVLGDGFRALAPTIVPMSKAISDGADAMKKWADKGGFANFLQKVHDNAPLVKQFLKNLVDALGNIAQALAGMGPGALALLNPLLKLVSILPPSVIQAMVYAYIAWQLAMAGAAIAATALAVALFLADAAATPFFLALAIASAPLWLIVAVFLAIVVVIAAFVVGLIELAVHWDGFIHGMATAGIAVWTALRVAWAAFIGAMITTWNAIAPALKAAWTATWSALNVAAMAVWNALRVAWVAFINAMNTTWLAVSGALRASWSAVWNALKTAAEAVWNALKAAWSAFFGAMSSVFATFNSGMRGAWSNLWNAIKIAAQAVWNVMLGAWRTFFGAMSTAYGTFAGALKGAWSTMWNTIKTVAQGVWTAISTGFKTFSSGVQTTLSGLVTAAGKIWNGIVAVFKTPINGVIKIWNTVASVFSLKKIPELASGGLISAPNVGSGGAGGGTTAFARGGAVFGAGGPTDDKIPAMLSNGEFVMNAKAVDHYGVDSMWAMNSRKLSTGGLVGETPGMALGGIIPSPGDILGGIGNVIGAVGGVITNAALGALKNLFGDAFMKAVTPLLDALAPPDPGEAGGIDGIPRAAYKMVEKAVIELFKTSSAIGGVIPVGQHKAIIDAALKAAGVPPPGTLGQWEAGLNTLITRESAWNSGAINLTDSNAQAGHPSQGLAQTIPSTFAAFHVAGTSNNILDPVANVAAAIRYIISRYGNITNVQQANANLPPAGYWRGTHSARHGWHQVGERGAEWVKFHGGEKVLPHGTDPEGAHGSRPVVVNVSHVWNGNPDKEAVQYAEGDMCDKLRQAVHAGVGGRNY